MEGLRITGLGHVKGWTEGLTAASALARATIYAAFQDMASVFLPEILTRMKKKNLFICAKFLGIWHLGWVPDRRMSWVTGDSRHQLNTVAHSQGSTDKNTLDVPG